MKYSPKVRELLDHLYRGEVDLVRRGIDNLLGKRLDRFSAVKLAYCARMVKSPERALKLLHRFVRTKGKAKLAVDLTSEILTEYAASLSELGASEEALFLLSLVPLKLHPQSGLQQALTHIRLWDWEKARSVLEEVLSLPDLFPMVRHASSVYLGSCLLHGGSDLKRARDHLSRAQKDLEETEFKYVLRSAMVLHVQALAFLGQYDQARTLLSEVRRSAEVAGAQDILAVTRKWTALLGLLEEGPLPSHLKALEEAKKTLLKLGLWERARGCDFYLAKLTRNKEVIMRLRAGTPYPAFQRKLDAEFGSAENQASYSWQLGPTSLKPVQWLDVVSGENSGNNGRLKPRQLNQRLLCALSSDLYRPFTAVELHERIFPGEYFNPETSMLKVYQALSRLRKWLSSQNLPIRIVERKRSYTLVAQDPCILKVPLRPVGKEDLPGPQVVEMIRALEEKFSPSTTFTTAEVLKLLKASRPSVVRYLGEAVRLGMLERRGKGKGTSYVLKALHMEHV